MSVHRLSYQLPAPERDLVEAARTLAIEHRQHLVVDAERVGRIDPGVFRAAADLGLTAIQVPRDSGGLGYSYGCKMAVTEAMSTVSMAFAFALVNTHNVAAKLAVDAPHLAEQWLAALLTTERFGATALTEPGAGSDFSAITTRAVRSDDGWTLNGTKTWITNAIAADAFVTYLQTDPEAGWRGIACFLVEADGQGFERAPALDTFGARTIGAGGFRLDGYRAPDAHCIHPAGEAFKRALGSINGARTYVAAMCCGMVAGALDQVLEYARQRHTFGTPLIDRQGLRWQLADLETDLEAARHLTYHAARAIDAGNDKAAMLAAAHAKKFATRLAERALPQCIQMMGANGLLAEHGLGHHLACARVAGYVDGSTEIQNERIAALCLGGA